MQSYILTCVLSMSSKHKNCISRGRSLYLFRARAAINICVRLLCQFPQMCGKSGNSKTIDLLLPPGHNWGTFFFYITSLSGHSWTSSTLDLLQVDPFGIEAFSRYFISANLSDTTSIPPAKRRPSCITVWIFPTAKYTYTQSN